MVFTNRIECNINLDILLHIEFCKDKYRIDELAFDVQQYWFETRDVRPKLNTIILC